MPATVELPTSRRGLLKTLAGSLLAWLAGLPLAGGTAAAEAFGASGPKPTVQPPRHSVPRERTAIKP